MMSLSFLKFIADLEQCRSWILESWSVILKFSLIAIFYLKLKREKISNIALAIAWSRDTIIGKKCWVFFAKSR